MNHSRLMMQFVLRSLSILFFAGLVAGCAMNRDFGEAADIEITALEELPAPRAASSYAIGPQEKLEIEVAGAELFSGTFLTDGEGAIEYPFLGTLDLSGRSPNEAARLIANGLRAGYLLDPQVRVIPETFPTPSISVGGQVGQPGNYPAVGQKSLLRVVNEAGGLTKYAKLDDVLIIRTVDGQRYIGVYNIGAIQRGNYADPQLYAEDIVMVGDSPERRRLENILQFVPLLTSTAIIADRVAR